MALVQTPELSWIAEAKRLIGTKEIKGQKHSQEILGWIKSLGGWWAEDETPWCGVFIAHCLKVANLKYPKNWMRAKDYADFGVVLAKPAYGCIGVKTRVGGGHVTFIIGKNTKTGKLIGLGGNQSDAVRLSEFNESDFIAFVWPNISPTAQRYNLPTTTDTYGASLKES